MLRMKTILLLLVALAVATGPAWALRCYVCTSSSNCKNEQTCPASSRFCKITSTVEPLTGNLVKKECVDSCMPNYGQQGQVSSGSMSIQCCQSDLCNEHLRLHSAAPAHAPLGTVVLSLALGLGLMVILVPSL